MIIKRLSAFIENIQLLNPEALFLLFILVPVFALLFLAYKRDIKMLNLLKASSAKTFKEYSLLSIAFVLLISGAVGMLTKPVVNEYNESELHVKGEYIFLLDVSRSSDARFDPESPSQLELAKETVTNLLSIMEGSQVQIFAYTSAAFPMSDFTTKTNHLEETLDNLVYSEVIWKSGSNLPNALASIAKLKKSDERYKNVRDVILISDGQISSKNAWGLNASIEMLKEQNLTLTTVGVGSIIGWRIPIFDENTGEFTGKYAKTGRSDYVSVLNERNLQILAGLTGGEYFNYQDTDVMKESFIEKAEESQFLTYVGKKELLESRDIGWLFSPLVIIGLLILVLRRNLI